jgi:hypothetical protein
MYPVSVALAGFIVHWSAPGSFFLLAAAALGASLCWALSQRAFRDFGTAPAADAPDPHMVDLKPG